MSWAIVALVIFLLLVVTGLYVAVFAVFLVWALLGLTQLMFAPTY